MHTHTWTYCYVQLYATLIHHYNTESDDDDLFTTTIMTTTDATQTDATTTLGSVGSMGVSTGAIVGGTLGGVIILVLLLLLTVLLLGCILAAKQKPSKTRYILACMYGAYQWRIQELCKGGSTVRRA